MEPRSVPGTALLHSSRSAVSIDRVGPCTSNRSHIVDRTTAVRSLSRARWRTCHLKDDKVGRIRPLHVGDLDLAKRGQVSVVSFPRTVAGLFLAGTMKRSARSVTVGAVRAICPFLARIGAASDGGEEVLGELARPVEVIWP